MAHAQLRRMADTDACAELGFGESTVKILIHVNQTLATMVVCVWLMRRGHSNVTVMMDSVEKPAKKSQCQKHPHCPMIVTVMKRFRTHVSLTHARMVVCVWLMRRGHSGVTVLRDS